MTNTNANGTDRSRRAAEAARETSRGESFLREVFAGRLRPELVERFVDVDEHDDETTAFLKRLESFLTDKVDPTTIDERGEYPKGVLSGLAEIGAFGMKIPKEYGGLGLGYTEYTDAMQLLGSHDGNVTALLSAHQAIGVPQPIMLFGTEAQKKRYLPRCARGSVSAFALTEPDVGSDPAKIETTATRIEDGDAYRIDGEKLWCTNGTIADLIVVMAKEADTERISAFVVPADAEGVRVEHRCRFMGLSALENGLISFDGVRVPAENMIGEPGQGLKIALTTLNTGRLSLPAAVTGAAKRCLEVARRWATTREQWGDPIGKHEAIAGKLSDMAATTFTMEAVVDVVAAMADGGDTDIRMEAASLKEWNTVRASEVIDDALQIRGGRGYERASSLEARGEAPIGIERMYRDARVNLIFEGTSEVMHLFVAREGLDEHMEVASAFADPNASTKARLAQLPSVAAHYAWWYPAQWVGAWTSLLRHGRYGVFAPHLRYLDRASRRLARTTFHAMVRYGAKLEKKQALLFRGVDAAMEIFAVTCALMRARKLATIGDENAAAATTLADAAFRIGRRRIEDALGHMFDADDELRYRVGREVLAADHDWLERGVVPLGLETEAFAPEAFRHTTEPTRRFA